jgi:Acetyltransferase (GNAT) domain
MNLIWPLTGPPVKDGKLTGYIVIRPCRNGYKIGPLFADSPEIADQLFCALKGQATLGAPVYLDIPDPHENALELVKRHDMNVVFETARMYTDISPNLPLDRLYGVITFELG